MAGDPVYFYFGSPDSGKARAFFGELLGWKFSQGNAPDGFNIDNIEPPGGLFGGGETDGRFRMYFRVDDLERAIARVEELGGQAGQPQPTDGGRFADCEDDQGFEFGIWAADD